MYATLPLQIVEKLHLRSDFKIFSNQINEAFNIIC